MTFRCNVGDECRESAEWLVWYRDCGNLYGHGCTNCVASRLHNETDEERGIIVQIRRIEDALHARATKKRTQARHVRASGA